MPPSRKPQPSLNLPEHLFGPFPAGRLYAIVDAALCAAAGRAPIDVARAFLSGGARWLQLRCKGMASGPFLDLANHMLADVSSAGAALIINDRADITALTGAHGLHVGQTDLSPRDSRFVIGAAPILGLSTHTREQWEAAVREPISYIAIGPAFGTGTKDTGYNAIGLQIVRQAATAAAARGIPAVAIGGITIDNAISVIEAGAAAVAVISDLLRGDPETRCREFLRALK